SVQSEMYLTYHMTNPRVFYNKEDVWRIPDEKTRGSTIDMEPYYIIMKIPGEEQPEFIQILPFSPRGKENMIGWLAARSDRPNYGELKSFLFSKQELIYGPMQIESRIDQDTDISKEITLLSQRGSSVIRGNLIVIPIADTVMYVEPFFLKSTGAGALPELKRVIVAQGDSLTMQPTLAESLDVLFGTGDGEPEDRLRRGVPGVNPERIQRLKEIYSQARDSLRRGDFAEYGDRIDRLGDVLNNVSVETNRVDNGSVATP
ncbi:MAG: UPF0182 family protein, partial [Halobacteria archaeon]|nr:UPF0182 family protein [Halobacteria archaeon]